MDYLPLDPHRSTMEGLSARVGSQKRGIVMGIKLPVSMLLMIAIIGCSPTVETNETSIEEKPQLVCETGPSKEIFGETDWLVYGCNEQEFLVVVSAPDNPATPFIFFLKRDASDIQISGEGTGNKEATRAALAELRSLTRADFKKLATRAQKARPKNS